MYEEIGQKKRFEETAEYNRYRKEKKWYEDVKSNRTGEYYQANELDIKEEIWYQKSGRHHMLTIKENR